MPPAGMPLPSLTLGTGAALTPEATVRVDRKATARAAVCCAEKCMMDTEWKRRQGKEMVIDRKAVLLVKIETILERRI